GDGAADQLRGLLVLMKLISDHAQEMQGVAMVGIGREDGLVHLGSIVKPTALVMLDCGLQWVFHGEALREWFTCVFGFKPGRSSQPGRRDERPDTRGNPDRKTTASVLSQKFVKQVLRPGPWDGTVSSKGDHPCPKADPRPNCS